MHDVPAADCGKAPRDRALTLWFTGLSGAGKSTLAQTVCASLAARNLTTDLLDSDLLRPLLSPDLTFSSEDRVEHARRLAARALTVTSQGILAVVCAVSPTRASRAEARLRLQPFLEVFIDAPLSICEQRDPLGLYRRYRNHEVRGVAGLDAPYEAPWNADVHCQTHLESIEQSTWKIVSAVLERMS